MAEAQHRQLVNLPLKSIYDCILDFDAYPRFVSGVRKAKVIDRTDSSIAVQMEVELMKKIDYSIAVQFEHTGEKAKVWWHLQDGDFFQKNDGVWELVTVDAQTTQVLYKLDIEFSVSVPSFIIKGLIKTSLPKAVEDFTEEAKRRSK